MNGTQEQKIQTQSQTTTAATATSGEVNGSSTAGSGTKKRKKDGLKPIITVGESQLGYVFYLPVSLLVPSIS